MRTVVATALALWASVQPLPATAQASADPVSATSLLQVLVGLAIVLAALVGTAWVLRRVGPMQGAGKLVRVLGGASVGTRERVVLVEVGDTWLVLGVAPGQVRSLATLARGEVPADAPASANGTFIEALRRVTEKRRAP